MSEDPKPRGQLEAFGAYQKARELFELVVVDMTLLARHPLCVRLVSQQMASADSICANIEEGYARGSKKDFCHFLVIARGSAKETRGRYERMARWIKLPVEDRLKLCDEVGAILTAAITTLRRATSVASQARLRR